MATLNLGRLKPVFRSTWNSATAYNVDDIVVRNNQSYISIQAGTNQDPATATAYWTLMAAKGSDGTDVGATLANKEIAFKTNAGAIDGIPIGNAGEFLKVNSGATGYEYGSVSSDFVKLGAIDISSSTAEVIFQNGTNGVVIDNTYRNYIVKVSNCQPTSQGAGIRFQIGVAGTIRTGSYLQEAHRSYYSGGTDRGNATGTICTFRGGAEDSVHGEIHCEVHFSDMTDATCKTSALGTGMLVDGDNSASNQVNQGTSGGVYSTAEANDTIKIYMNSGNIAKGQFTLYGLK